MNVYDTFIDHIQIHGLKWVEPWKTLALKQVNPISNIEYSGLTYLLLSINSYKNNCGNRWANVHQIKTKGWHLNARAKQYPVYEVVDSSLKEVDLVSNFNDIFPVPINESNQNYQSIDIIKQIINNSNIKVYHDQFDTHYYDSIDKSIHLPNMDKFSSKEQYYLTILHEIVHATLIEPGQIFDKNTQTAFMMAKQEFLVDLVMIFLCSKIGLGYDLPYHENYTGIYPDILRQENSLVNIINLAERLCSSIMSGLTGSDLFIFEVDLDIDYTTYQVFFKIVKLFEVYNKNRKTYKKEYSFKFEEFNEFFSGLLTVDNLKSLMNPIKNITPVNEIIIFCEKIQTDAQNNNITLVLTDSIIKYTELRRHLWKFYNLDGVSDLKNVYAIKFYNLICQYKSSSEVIIRIPILKKILPQQNLEYKHLKQKFLLNYIADIKKFHPTIQFAEIKQIGKNKIDAISITL